jgi:hypothetical protein
MFPRETKQILPSELREKTLHDSFRICRGIRIVAVNVINQYRRINLRIEFRGGFREEKTSYGGFNVSR